MSAFSLKIVSLLLAAALGMAWAGIGSAQTPPTATPAVRAPSLAPDVAAGAAVFAAHCTACHGETGEANGVLVAAGSVPQMTNFRTPDGARRQRPTEWFGTITYGHIENMMPPWGEALSDAERWAVAAYTYTLHYTPETLAFGREVYRNFCAACHGETGIGDGPDAETLRKHPGDLTDVSAMLALADSHMYVAVAEGAGEMPAFADDLSEEEMWASVAYTRTLALANPDAIGQIVSPEATSEPAAVAVGTVSGQIINGTAGGRVPSGMAVTVYRLDATFERTEFTTTAADDGAFRIEGVPLDPASNYVAAVTYRERLFTSGAAAGIGDRLDLPLSIYELTEDPAVIAISGMVTQVTAVGDSLEVAQVISFANMSDRAFTSSEITEDGRPISVVLALPVGAVVAGLVDQVRFAVLADEYLVIDTQPVIPGVEHVIQLVYLIPYDAGGAIIEQPLNYAVAGPVRLLLAPAGMNATSDQLAEMGSETIGETEFQAYGGDLALRAGDALRFTIAGVPPAAAAPPGSAPAETNNLPLFILLLIAGQGVVIGALYLLLARRRRAPALTSAQLIDALVRQIAELDADFEAGKLEAMVYERQRALLKERLAVYMQKTGDGR